MPGTLFQPGPLPLFHCRRIARLVNTASARRELSRGRSGDFSSWDIMRGQEMLVAGKRPARDGNDGRQLVFL